MIILTVTILAFTTHNPIESPKAIPLDTIWAWKMPGTKNVRELEDDFEEVKNLVADQQIQRSVAVNTFSLLHRGAIPKGKQNAGTAFIVVGKKPAALVQTNAILGGREAAKLKFRTGVPLTLVFYAYGSSQFVYLDEVIQDEKEIIVRYHFHHHGLRKSTQHYALIPLRKISKRSIKVTVERTANTSEDHLANAELPKLSDSHARKLVCGSSEFEVFEPPE